MNEKIKKAIDICPDAVYNTFKQLNNYSNVQNITDERKADIQMKKTYSIEVDCANCAMLMEEAAKKTDGVKDASVNFMMLRMTVEFEDGADEKKVMKQVLKNCRRVEDDCSIEF